MSTEPLIFGPDRPAGTLLGAAVGDALGWPQEDRSKIVGGNTARRIKPAPHFRDWVRHGGTRYAAYLDPVEAGEYSDDTQLMLAVARACLRGPDWWRWLTTVELPQWPLYERGGGGAVLRAARTWARGRPPWRVENDKDAAAADRYFQAGGNGVAMRVAAHAIVAAVEGQSQDELSTRVIRDGLSTHGHPQALVGAVLHAISLARALAKAGTLEYGEMLDWLIHDRSWMSPAILMDTAQQDWHSSYRALNDRRPNHLPESWDEAAEQTLSSLRTARESLDRGTLANDQATLEAIGCFDGRRSGAGTVAAVAALYVASRSASRPVSGLLRTAFLHGSDTDTIASMTGSLLGAVHGTAWLGPMGHQVQDAEYLANLAGRLTQLEEHLQDRPMVPRVTESSLRTWSKNLVERHVDELPDGRQFHLEASVSLETKSNGVVTRSIGRAEDGQTVLVDKLSRGARRSGASVARQPEPVTSRPGIQAKNAGSVVQAPESESASSAIVRLELRVSNLEAAQYFYGEVLGLSLQKGGGRLRLENGLHITPVTPSSLGAPTSNFVLTLAHPDPSALADRAILRGLQVAWSQDGATLWLKDPDGNAIRVNRLSRS